MKLPRRDDLGDEPRVTIVPEEVAVRTAENGRARVAGDPLRLRVELGDAAVVVGGEDQIGRVIEDS